MRLILALLGTLTLAGCAVSHPALPDGGATDMAVLDAAPPDAASRICAVTCDRCAKGPCCGSACCGAGEWCDSATATCHCGDGPSCSGGDFCATGGPIIGGSTSGCGTLCCGSAGMPCPL